MPTCPEEAFKMTLDKVKAKWVTMDDKFEDETHMPMVVSRNRFWSNVMDDLYFNTEEEWRPRLRVSFIDESRSDTGGPSREFFSFLYASALDSSITDDQAPFVTFAHNQTALNQKMYLHFGRLMAVLLLICCAGPNYFSPTLVILYSADGSYH